MATIPLLASKEMWVKKIDSFLKVNNISYQKVLNNREFAHKMSFAPICDDVDSSNATVQFSR